MSGNKTVLYKNSVEENRKIIESRLWKSPEEKIMVKSMKARYGADITNPYDKTFPIAEAGFNWQAVKEKIAMKEADASGAFVQVLRAGVQSLVNSMYMSVPTTFEQWAQAINSTKDTELYAPLQGIGFPSEIGQDEKYPEVGAAGLDLKLQNRKYGTIYPVTMELAEDDQTGQFKNQVRLLSAYAKQVLEVLCYAKLQSVASMRYANLSIPTTEMKPSDESSYPWSTALVGGGKNRPASFGVLNQANVQTGIIGLMNQLNRLGLKMAVQPKHLLISPHYEFDAATLLNSSYWPSGAAATPATGGAFAINPIKGVLELLVSRFVFNDLGSVNADSKAWYILDGTAPWFVCQIREAAVVTQEVPNSGASFDRDVYRFKVRTRANADHIDSRFAWLGSDGSV